MSQQDMDRPADPRVAWDTDGEAWEEIIADNGEPTGLFKARVTDGDGDELTLGQIDEQYGLDSVDAGDRDLLLWLHAEAVWRGQVDLDDAREGFQSVVGALQRMLASQGQHMAELNEEIYRLRREVEFEARGANTFGGADAIADGDCVTFVAEDFGLDVDTNAGGVYVSLNHRRTARTEAWGDDVNVDYDADGIPTGVEILRRPSRAVHPEADR